MNRNQVTFPPSSSSVSTIEDSAGCYLTNWPCVHIHADGKASDEPDPSSYPWMLRYPVYRTLILRELHLSSWSAALHPVSQSLTPIRKYSGHAIGRKSILWAGHHDACSAGRNMVQCANVAVGCCTVRSSAVLFPLWSGSFNPFAYLAPACFQAWINSLFSGNRHGENISFQIFDSKYIETVFTPPWFNVRSLLPEGPVTGYSWPNHLGWDSQNTGLILAPCDSIRRHPKSPSSLSLVSLRVNLLCNLGVRAWGCS